MDDSADKNEEEKTIDKTAHAIIAIAQALAEEEDKSEPLASFR